MRPAAPTPVGDVQWHPLRPPQAVADGVAAAFAAEFGTAPDGVWAAPGRVNLIGEHVDYNAGLCLPLALPQRTFVALATAPDDRVHLRSLQDVGEGPGPAGRQARWAGRLTSIAPGTVGGWAAYAAGVPWSMRQAGLRVPGIRAVIDGDVPIGSGLSSSAALECAVALAVDDVAQLHLGGDDAGRAQLAALCVQAENEIAGAPTGGMDQAAALRCRPDHALLLDCRDASVEQVPLDLAGAGLALLVIDTRARHALLDGQYGSRRRACERACRLLGVRSLRELRPGDLEAARTRLATAAADPGDAEVLTRRVRHVVTEIERVSATVEALRSRRFEPVGAQLDASHRSLRDDYQVSCPELDLACEAAGAAGARGARMTGGGFGGSAIALVAADQVDLVCAAVDAALRRQGFRQPAFLRAVPSAAAERIS